MNGPTAPVAAPAPTPERRHLLHGALALVAVLLLVMRKPWALHTPQLWAEDGTIFLAFNDLHGLHAFLEPYMGYLHTIPRLTAWIASHTLDPRWWPAFYNWTAFAGTLAVIARTFSRRLPLPGKPWLALAFILGPQTGEVFFTITNLQWFTAILLVEFAIVLPPRNAFERISDLALIVLVGLTGPFVIAFWPLLFWRWWRERTNHDLAILLLATACAVVQGVFVLRTGPHFDWPPFDPMRFVEVLGQRFLAWPLLGRHLAVSLPGPALALIGLVPTVAFLAWSLRPGPRRYVRVTLVAAFLLISGALIVRSRPDTWGLISLDFADRYFYIPRVLLFWLLILEFDAPQRAVRWLAIAACLVIALVNLRNYTPPAPPDYHWAEQCDPIRRGKPANIPTLPEGWTMEYRGRPRI